MKKAKKVTIKQKAKKVGIPAQLVYNRMNDGWSEKKALSVPVRKRAKPKKSTPVLSKEPKKVAYKVEPKKEQASGSRVKHIPMEGIQKFEAPKDNRFKYVMVASVIIVILVLVAINT